MLVRVLTISVAGSIFAGGVLAQAPSDAPASPLDQKEASPEQKQRAEDLAVLTTTASRSTLTLPHAGRTELRREPAYRWSNSVGTSIGRHVKDAALFFWMADERPIAVTTVVWYTELGLFQEFLSLSAGPLTASRGPNAIWAPEQAGVTFQPVPDAPSPANNAAGRLNQMKALARRFQGEVVKGPPTYPEGSIWQLRLLPRPLMRYGAPEQSVGDGALFALCQDADPEACLMLDVRGDDKRPAWYFAMAPLTSRELRIRYDEDLVWSKPLIAPASDPKRPYYVLGPIKAP
jgi:hypothetical protein